ncbi:carboxypeptidase-like regulatory domain-containing protein [Yeosuana sp. AK3]
MKKHIIIFQLFFLPFLYGQTPIKGTIINTETSVPIGNANIYIDNTSLGTISNEDGEFVLVIPEKLKKNSLLFSSLGFETQETEISELEKQNNIIIKLKPIDIILDEIIITANKIKLNADQIVQEAFKNYYKNSPIDPYVAKGFIRHTEKTEKEYKWLVEGAFEMYNSGYNKKDEVKINVIETRKSLDNRIVDTAYVMRTYLHDNNNSSFKKNYNIAENYKTISPIELDKAFAFYDNHYTSGYNKNFGLLEKILSTDINKVGYYNKKEASFSEKTLKLYTFKIDTVFGFGNEKIYKIKFSKSIKKSSKLDIGYLYVQNKNFAITEIKYSVLVGKSHHRWKATGQNMLYTTNIKFKEYEEKMYPFYISHETFKINNLHSLKNSENHEEVNSVIGYLTHQEILFSEIITQKQEIVKITENSKYWNDNIFLKEKYNSSFWDIYNFILESKEQQKLILDLEKKVSLKKQFEQQ